MRNKVVQISLFDTYTDVLNKEENDKSEFIRLLEEYIDFETIIPYRFYNAFYSGMGRKRIHSLESYVRALILQRLLGLEHISQLRTILSVCKELKDFCGFTTLPDAPQFSRFKQNYVYYINLMFEQLVEITAPICKEIDEKKSQYLILIQQVLNPMSPKTTISFSTQSLNRQRPCPRTIRVAILIKSYTVYCPITLKKLLPQSSSTSTGISATLTRQVSLPTVWESSDILPFLMKISERIIPR